VLRGVAVVGLSPQRGGARRGRHGNANSAMSCGPVGRDMGVVRHHFDIGVVSVFGNIRNMASQFSFAGAKLCEPGDNRDRSGLVTRGVGNTRSQGLHGTGMATDKGISVGWEAW
jgi:hypothetical protein